DQQRFEALEIKLTHLEDTVAALGAACASQQRELAELRERLRIVNERLAGYESPEGASATAHEPPPHY
ncbi:MAG: SlyX family protein, partial [Steroidobacteraceae bacterium]